MQVVKGSSGAALPDLEPTGFDWQSGLFALLSGKQCSRPGAVRSVNGAPWRPDGLRRFATHRRTIDPHRCIWLCRDSDRGGAQGTCQLAFRRIRFRCFSRFFFDRRHLPIDLTTAISKHERRTNVLICRLEIFLELCRNCTHLRHTLSTMFIIRLDCNREALIQ